MRALAWTAALLEPTQPMRQVFARLEKGQREILARHHIPEFEPCLRPARRQARRLLERAWALAAGQGLELSPEELGKLHEQILVVVLAPLERAAPGK